MSAKKEEKKVAPAKVVAPVKKSKIDRMTKVKRDENGKKEMNVARGSARAARREGIKKGWRNVANAKPMLPAANVADMEAAA